MLRRPNSADAPRSFFGPVAVLCGGMWALNGWIGTMDPNYASASSTLDYASVLSYSAALIALAVSIWHMRVTRRPWVSVGGAVAALGLLIAGIANIGEDWFGIRAIGVVYLAAIVIGTLALIPLGVLLGREARTRWIALLPLLTFPGLVFVSQWYGSTIPATTWLVAGALHSVGRLALSSDRR